MHMSDYQKLAHKTARYNPDTGIYYATLGLVGEAGEIANKVKKIIRDHGGAVTPAVIADLKSEVGDVLWYAAEICTILGIDLGEVAEANVAKLRDRTQRNVIQGSGDVR